MYLEQINSPADIKKMSVTEMNELSHEIRQALLQKLSKHGGHFGPNFGMVEATIALHYVFNSPEDKIVFDVSHQSYTHKILTGRKAAFLHPEQYDEVSGYSEPTESKHDHFVIGHTSTSVSLAGGLAKGRDLTGQGGNVIAVIGDGSLSGGKLWKVWIMLPNWVRISSLSLMTTRCPLQKTMEDFIVTCRNYVKATDNVPAIFSVPWDWIISM